MNTKTDEPKTHDVVVHDHDDGQGKEMEVVTHDVPSAYMLPNTKQIAEYEEFLKNYDGFVNRMLNEGTDYGVIPGVEKPTLLKPGAEKLEKLFFLRSKKDCILKDVREDGSFIRYTYRTTIYNKQGQVVGTCEGTCNSHEKKYRWQTVFDNQATEEQKKEGKLEERTSRAGKKYKVYVIEKKDFYDMENTIMKMAQKRSYVGAILEATNSSSRFTQDVEDMDQSNFAGNNSETTPPPPKKTPGVAPQMFGKVKASIQKTEDPKMLEDIKTKVEKSDKYSDEQKKELADIISQTLKDLKKK